jgi:hypothetical protein
MQKVQRELFGENHVCLTYKSHSCTHDPHKTINNFLIVMLFFAHFEAGSKHMKKK